MCLRIDARDDVAVLVGDPDRARASRHRRGRALERDLGGERGLVGLDDGDAVGLHGCQSRSLVGVPCRCEHTRQRQRRHARGRRAEADPMPDVPAGVAQRGARCLHQLCAGRPAAFRVLVERAREHGVQCPGQPSSPLADAQRRFLQVSVDHGGLRRPVERRRAGQALEQEAAERVEVRAGVGIARADDLGRHVPHGSREATRCRDGRVARQLPAQPEVGEVDLLGVAVRRHECVRRLDVPVDEPACVRGVERRRQLGDQPERALRVERAFAAQQLRQVRPVHVAHGDVEPTIDVTGLVDGDHATMLDRCQEPSKNVGGSPSKNVGRGPRFRPARSGRRAVSGGRRGGL